jgi:hypothetical protein
MKQTKTHLTRRAQTRIQTQRVHIRARRLGRRSRESYDRSYATMQCSVHRMEVINCIESHRSCP